MQIYTCMDFIQACICTQVYSNSYRILGPRCNMARVITVNWRVLALLACRDCKITHSRAAIMIQKLYSNFNSNNCNPATSCNHLISLYYLTDQFCSTCTPVAHIDSLLIGVKTDIAFQLSTVIKNYYLS